MKLRSEFITHELDGEQIMVSSSGSFSGYLKNNKTAAYIVDLLREEITREEIISKMIERYAVSEEIISRDVDRILETLKKVGAINE